MIWRIVGAVDMLTDARVVQVLYIFTSLVSALLEILGLSAIGYYAITV